MTDKSKILNRIALLLRKAESTTPAEAEALTEHAQRLMLRHGIDVARAHAAATGHDIRPEEIVDVSFDVPPGPRAMAVGTFAAQIAEAYGPVRCYMVRKVNHRGRFTFAALHIVGFASDAAAVRDLVTSLLLQAQVAEQAWWETAKWSLYGAGSATKAKARRDFMVGFGVGAARRLKETRLRVHDEAEAEQPGTALALRDRRAEVDAHTDGMGLGRARAYQPKSGYRDGIAKGAQANVGANEIAGQRAIAAAPAV